MKVGIVIWNDAHSDEADSWLSISRRVDHSPFEVVTVGIILDSNSGKKRGHVSVAQSLTPSEYVDHVIHIPKAMIVEVIDLFDIEVTDETIKLDSKRSTNSGRLSTKSRTKRRTRRARTDATCQQTSEDQ
jgi:hypothetical protein